MMLLLAIIPTCLEPLSTTRIMPATASATALVMLVIAMKLAKEGSVMNAAARN